MTGGYYGNRRSRLELQDSIWKLQDKVEGEEKQRDELKGELESIHLYWITHCGKFVEHERVLQTSQVNILAWQKPKARSSVWIVQNDVHIAKL